MDRLHSTWQGLCNGTASVRLSHLYRLRAAGLLLGARRAEDDDRQCAVAGRPAERRLAVNASSATLSAGVGG